METFFSQKYLCLNFSTFPLISFIAFLFHLKIFFSFEWKLIFLFFQELCFLFISCCFVFLWLPCVSLTFVGIFLIFTRELICEEWTVKCSLMSALSFLFQFFFRNAAVMRWNWLCVGFLKNKRSFLKLYLHEVNNLG